MPWEAPIGFVEPKQGRELLQVARAAAGIANEAVSIHRLYRRAEGVQGHLQPVPVPDVEPHDAGGNPAEGEASR